MLFLLKSIFWLGLVFIIAPGADPHDQRRKDAGLAAAQVTAEAAGALAAALPGVALEVCKQAPRECVNGALQLKPGEKRPKAAGSAPRRVVDTLTSNDREPNWRGQKPQGRQI